MTNHPWKDRYYGIGNFIHFNATSDQYHGAYKHLRYPQILCTWWTYAWLVGASWKKNPGEIFQIIDLSLMICFWQVPVFWQVPAQPQRCDLNLSDHSDKSVGSFFVQDGSSTIGSSSEQLACIKQHAETQLHVLQFFHLQSKKFTYLLVDTVLLMHQWGMELQNCRSQTSTLIWLWCCFCVSDPVSLICHCRVVKSAGCVNGPNTNKSSNTTASIASFFTHRSC